MPFVWYVCTAPSCRFRFPAQPAELPQANRCPRCGETLQSLSEATLTQTAVLPPILPQHQLALHVLLDNIRSSYNVGAMFRTADGAGVTHMHLGGMTATPAHPRVAKTALGAEQAVPWSHHLNSVETAVALQQAGFALWALEAQPEAEPLFTSGTTIQQPTALIVGNERAGVDPGLLALCDRILALPMRGQKSSLNASVAFGITLYHIQFNQQLSELN